MPTSIRVTPDALSTALTQPPTELSFTFPDPLPAGALPALKNLLASPAMANVTSLDYSQAHEGDDVTHEIRDYSDTMLQDTVRTWHGKPVIDALAAGRFKSLKSLKLVEINFDSRQLESILAAVPPLESLDLSDNPIDDAGLKALAESRHAATLKELRLSKCPIGADGIAALARSVNLTTLNLDFCKLTDAALAALFRAPFAAGASLVCCLAELQSVDALVTSPWLAAQTELSLAGAKLDATSIVKLISSPAVARLEALELDRIVLGAPGAAIGASPHLANLARLTLKFCKIDAAAAAAIASSPHLARLTDLDLGFNHMRDAGVGAMLSAWGLTALKRLDLTRNDITDEGAKLLAASPAIARLESLNVHGNKIGDDGAVALALTPVKWLDVGSNAVGKRGEKALNTRKPPPAPAAPASAPSGDPWDAVFNAPPAEAPKLAATLKGGPLPKPFEIDDREIRSRLKLEGHHGKITAWDAAGGVIATAGRDKTLRLWNAVSGKQLRYITLDEPRSALSLTPDGAIVAATWWNPYDLTLTAWETATGKALYAVGAKMRSCAFSPDGSLLCGGAYDGTVSLWNAKTGAPRAVLGRHEDPADFVEFSLDGTAVRSIDYRGKTLVHTLTKGSPAWRSTILSPDGRWELRGAKDEPELFDGGRRVGILTGHEGVKDARVWRRTLITMGNDELSVRLWDLLPGWTKDDIAMARARKGTSWSFVAGVLEKRYGAPPAPPPAKPVTADQVLAGHPLHTVPSADWEAMTDKRVAPLAPIAVAARLHGIKPFPAPALLIERTERRLDPEPPAPFPVLGEWDREHGTAVSPDRTLMARGREHGEVELFDATGRKLAERKLDGRALQLLFSPDAKLLAVGHHDGSVEIFDVGLKELRVAMKKESQGGNDWVSAMAFSPDGRCFATHTYEGRTTLWDAATGAERATFTVNGEALAFSGDGARVAHPGGVFDAVTGRVIARPKTEGSVLALSHDGRLLASAGSRQSIELWHVDAKVRVAAVPAEEWWVQRLAFVQDRLIARATAAYESRGPKGAKVWEILDFQPMGLFTPDDAAHAKTRNEPAWKFVAEKSL